ncbi:MAG: hypothetical protein CMJ81_15195 [Planctomycetaceae bacterium]|nr:hypothetical protein [Planctomycetaceae bacterium]MBP62073.1 hypothetical protein [Planctomycetaceae bacterium]
MIDRDQPPKQMGLRNCGFQQGLDKHVLTRFLSLCMVAQLSQCFAQKLVFIEMTSCTGGSSRVLISSGMADLARYRGICTG